jgi:hypothetical protein
MALFNLTPLKPSGNYAYHMLLTSSKENDIVEWLALLFYIRKVPGSSISQKTGYLAWGFSCKCRDSILNQTTTAAFHILLNSSFSYNALIGRDILSYWENVVK